MVYFVMVRWDGSYRGWSKKQVAVVQARGDIKPALLSTRAKEMLEILSWKVVRPDAGRYLEIQERSHITVNLLNAGMIEHDDGNDIDAVAGVWLPTLLEAVERKIIASIVTPFDAAVARKIRRIHARRATEQAPVSNAA